MDPNKRREWPSRVDGVLSQRVGEEFVVVEPTRTTAFSLTGLSARVWSATQSRSDHQHPGPGDELFLGAGDFRSQVDLVIEDLTDAGLLVRSGPSRRTVLLAGSSVAIGGLLAMALPSPADAASVPPPVLSLACGSSYTVTAGPSPSARTIFFTVYAGGGSSGSNQPPIAGALSAGNGAGGDAGYISGSITLPASDTATTFDTAVGCGGLDSVGGLGPMPGGDVGAGGTNGDGGGGGGATTVTIASTVVLAAGGGGGGGSASVSPAPAGSASGGSGSGLGSGSNGQSNEVASAAAGAGATSVTGGRDGSAPGDAGSTPGGGPVPAGGGGTGGVPGSAVITSGAAGGGGGGYFGGGGGAAGTTSTGGGGGGAGYTSNIAVGASGSVTGAVIYIGSAGTVSAAGPGRGGAVSVKGAPASAGTNGQAQFSGSGDFTLTAAAHPLPSGAGRDDRLVDQSPTLGAASTFSVLAVTSIVNTGATNIGGDIGVGPAGTVGDFPPGTVSGSTHIGDTAANQAITDFNAAYANAAARTPTATFAGDQNGQTFTPGVYRTLAAFSLTGTLTLDGQGDPNATFIFQVDAALNTAASSIVTLVNGAKPANVFWQVLGAATTGATSVFRGTILANGAINIGADSQLTGQALSRGTVTLANDTIRFSPIPSPTVTINGGATAKTVDVTPTVSGTTSAPPSTPVTVTVNGQTLTTTAQDDRTWSVTAAALAAGSYPTTASVRDAFGDYGSATQGLTIQVNPSPVPLAAAAGFSVLAPSSVVNTGATTVNGNLGVGNPGTATGFPPGTVTGSVHIGDAPASTALEDATTAYNNAASRTPSGSFSGDLNGQTVYVGVYRTAAAFALTGTLTLDGEGDPNAVFIFQVGAALNTAANSTISLINGAQASNVFWQVAGAVNTGGTSTFSGVILANGAITLGASSQLTGRALSTGTITLDTNTIS